MIRPGMSNPRMGAQRTRDLRDRIEKLLAARQYPRGAGRPGVPRMGGAVRRPVAGPGVRQFSGQGGPLQPSSLQALTERFGGALVPFTRPGPTPGMVGEDFTPPGLPEPPAVGGLRDRLIDYPRGSGPGTTSVAGQIGDLFGEGPTTLSRPPEGWFDFSGAGSNLIPLGGGTYYNTETGQLHGASGIRAF